MSGPNFKPIDFKSPIMNIDRPHGSVGPHVDHVTPFGCGALKDKIDTNGNIASSEIVLQGGTKIKI